MRVLKLDVSNRRDKKYVADVIIDDKLYQNVHFGNRKIMTKLINFQFCHYPSIDLK